MGIYDRDYMQDRNRRPDAFDLLSKFLKVFLILLLLVLALRVPLILLVKVPLLIGLLYLAYCGISGNGSRGSGCS
ncbi:MAG: hypothetical protein ACE361_23980 [Aureliella sp.]